MKRGAMNVCYGGQCGSEAKGKLAAYLVDKFDIKVVAGNLSPNAGHTVIKDGMKTVTHHIPVGVMGGHDLSRMMVVLGPASVINPILLIREIEMLKEGGFDPYNLIIDERAAIITQAHVRSEEGAMTVIGSTAQGVGEARVDKLMRRGITAKTVTVSDDLPIPDTSQLIRAAMKSHATVMYEMGQGFDLCIDHGIDPVYCTSRNCTPMQALADMGVSAKYLGDVYAVIRPYPIRVNNRDGSSGPYPSEEITWEEVRERCGAPMDITEITTTTKLTRRVFEFAWERMRTMVNVCAPDFLVLQFANYLDWKCYGVTDKCGLGRKVMDFVGRLENETGVPVAYIGTGPSHGDMVDMRIDRLED